jgi:phage-related protein
MAIEAGAAYISLLPSLRGFSARVRRELKTELRGLGDDFKIEPKVDIRTAVAEARQAVRAAQASAPPLRITPEIDRKVLRDLGKTVLSGLAGVGAGAGKLAGLGLAVGTLATVAAGAVASVGALVPAVVALGAAAVTASGALVAVPGAIALAVVGVNLLKLGLVGLDDAFKAVASGDAAKLNEALKVLAPNARAAVRQLAAFKPAFDRMRLGVQERLFAGFGDRIRELARAHFPALTAGANAFATVVNSRLTTALKSLSSDGARLDLGIILKAAATAAGNLGAALTPALAAFRDLVTVGAQLTAELSGGLVGVVTDFAKRISEMRANGELEQMFRSGMAVLGQFKDLAVDIVGILGNLGQAASAGGKGATGIFAFFDRLNAITGSVAGQNALTSLFTELGNVAVALTPVLVTLLQAIVPIAKGIASIAVAFAPSLTTLVQALGEALGEALAELGPAIEALAPSLGILAQSFQPLAFIISDLLVGLAPGLESILTAVAGALKLLVPAALPVAYALSGVGAAGAPQIKVLGAQHAYTLISLSGPLEGLAKAVTPLIQLFAATFVAALQQLLPPLMEAAKTGVPLLADAGLKLLEAFRPLAPVVLELAKSFAGQLTEALPKLTAMAQQLVPIIGQLAATFGEQLLVFLKDLTPVLPGLVASGLQLALAMGQLFIAISPLLPHLLRMSILGGTVLAGALYVLTSVLQLMAALVRNGAANIAGLIGIARQVPAAISAGAAAVGRFGSSVAGAITSALTYFRGLPGQIGAAIGNMGSLLYNAGRNVVQGLINGIQDMLGQLRSIAGEMAGTIRNFLPFSPAKTGPLSGRGNPLYSGRAIASLLAEGVESRIPLVAASAAELAAVFAISPSPTGRLRVAGISGAPAAPAAGLAAGGGTVEDLLRRLILAVEDGKEITVDGVVMARTVNRVNTSQARR